MRVARASSRFLADKFRIKSVQVLYDRPASAFTPIDRVEREQIRQAVFTRLGVRGGNAVGFIVCPTSWTEDEDFDLVIEAARHVEDRIRGWEAGKDTRRFPDLVVLVTGDGARRAEFERRFAGLLAHRVQLRTRWLDPEDYPRIVGSADVGLCLHRSSSGVDIPMKVADLFGAGVPVCALDYGACLAERVRHGDNGLLFSNGRTARRRAVRAVRDLPGRLPAARPSAERRAAVSPSDLGRRVDQGSQASTSAWRRRLRRTEAHRMAIGIWRTAGRSGAPLHSARTFKR